MKIFYSWQSDTPGKIGKTFIREALDTAVSSILASTEFEEASRPTIDQDTQGVLGSPSVANTIFEKIKKSDIVLADISLVGSTPKGKKLINSNVAIEYGYAIGEQDDQVMLAVMNTHYGSPEELPFDLAHRRWPVRYDLSPGSSKEEVEKSRKQLTKKFKEILLSYIESKPKPAKTHFERIPSKLNAACYFEDNEVLDRRESHFLEKRIIELKYSAEQPLIYLRIWPTQPIGELTGVELASHQFSRIEPLLERTLESSFSRNKYGAITYSFGDQGQLFATTQVFQNKEIWGVEAYSLTAAERQDYDFGIIPTQTFEQGVMNSLNSYLDAAFKRFFYLEAANIEVGLVNIDGFKLATPNSYDDRFVGPIFGNILVTATVEKGSEESHIAALLKIFEAVFDAAGMKRPKHLYNFPPRGN